ncbi:hypothetical protein Tco_1203738 [Tanacetum coccineum]
MGRDTIQLEDAVSTISQEYLLEFSSEYFIPENLYPELPGLGDHIVDFPEGKVDEKVFPTVVAWRTAATKDDKPKANTYSVVDVATLDTHRTPIQKQPDELLCLVGLSRNFFLRDDEYPIFLNDNDQEMDLFNLIKALNPTKVKTETRQRTAHEVPLLTATANRVIQMVDATELSTSSRTPSTVERSSLDFSNEDAPSPVTQGAEGGVHGPTTAEQEIPRRRQRDAGKGGSNAPAKVIRKDHDAARTEHSARGGKSLADMSVDTELAIHVHETQEPPVATQSVSDPDPLSYAKPQPNPKKDVAQSSKEEGVARNQDSEKSTPSPSISGSPGSIYQPGWGMPNSCCLDTPEACQDVVDHIAPPGYFYELRHLPTDEFLSQYNINLAKQVAMGSQLRLRFEQEAKLLKKSIAQAQEMGEKRIMAAFEDFKKHEDERVNSRCAEMDAQLDVLSVDFNEELYSHIIKASFCQCYVYGDSQGYERRVEIWREAWKAGLELTDVEAYDPEANNKFVAALHDLKDLNYPLIDELEQLKDAPLDVIMASLYLDSDTGEDVPQFIRDLRPSSSQLKIPMYPEVRDPRNPWACKEEIILEDAIAENISRAEKKKKNRVVCRTHKVGSAHHARSDGIPVSVPTIAPQGLQILLVDAAT